MKSTNIQENGWTNSRRQDARAHQGAIGSQGNRQYSEILLGLQGQVPHEILDALPAAIYTTDALGRLTYFNQACVNFSGRTPTIGTDHWCVTWKLYHPDGSPMRHDECPMAVALKTGEIVRGEEAIAERPDGSRIWFEPYPTPLRDNDGMIIGGINMLVDITDRKQADHVIRRSEGELAEFFENASIGIHWVGSDGKISRVNRAELELLGYSREEYLGHHIAEFHADQPVIEDILARLKRGETLRDFEARLRCKDGSIKVVLIDSSVLWDGDQMVHTRCFTRDVSAAKATEIENKRRYTDGVRLTETNRALVGALSIDQVTNVVCRAARELTGADGAAFVLREGNRVRFIDENAIEPLWKGKDFPIESRISGWAMLHNETAIIEDISADDRIPKDEYAATYVKSVVITPVGPVSPVASIAVFWAKKYRASVYELELLASLASASDLALSGVRAYQNSLRARAQAEEANRLKDEFLATLSHELRNPLNSVIGFSELLLRNAEARQSQFVSQAARVIHRNAKGQAQLINDLLDLSRLHTGKLNVELMPLALNEVVKNALESVRQNALEKEVTIKLETGDEEVMIRGDALRIQQIIWNLVTNAIKFSNKDGHVLVRVRKIDQCVQLVVEDDGQGIAAEFLPYVFEMFRQADGSTKRKQGGMGIGLAIVKQLTELHDGTVEAYSPGLGKGSQFMVTFPLYFTREERHLAPLVERSEVLCGIKILIADDTPDSLEMLSALLSREGAIVETASNGEEAFSLASRSLYDIVISDIAMPVMDGYEFLTKLRRNNPSYKKIPSIALTGFGREEDLHKALESGFATHFTKPLDFENLLRTVISICQQTQAVAG